MSYNPNNPNGLTVSASSAPVVIASDQPAISIKQAVGTNLHSVVDSGTITAVTAITNALPIGTNVIGALTANQSVNVAQLNGVAPLMGNGVTGTGSQRVNIASDNTPFAIKIDQTTAGTTNGVQVNAALPTGTNSIGNIGSITTLPTLANVTTVAAVTTITNAVNIGTKTTGGTTAFTLISAATVNATNVKPAAGTLYGIQASNTGAAAAFLKIYNLAVAPTVGTSVAVKTLIIPAGGGIVVSLSDMGSAFSLGIAVAITGLAATADTTPAALSQVVVNLDFA